MIRFCSTHFTASATPQPLQAIKFLTHSFTLAHPSMSVPVPSMITRLPLFAGMEGVALGVRGDRHLGIHAAAGLRGWVKQVAPDSTAAKPSA